MLCEQHKKVHDILLHLYKSLELYTLTEGYK